ncbi:MAG: DASS family sodium-coupled anion symporter [Candidatus Nitrosocaldus sp.]|nr:DASS family sodium-coupled anion symporter [Candidatus Nitrosocaldus sp.]
MLSMSGVSIKTIGSIIGPISFLLILIAPTPTGLSEEGRIVLAIASWMIVWWVTEAISVYATALLPLALLPMMGIMPLTDVASEYMHPIVVLLLGMFLIAISIEKSGLHRRIALMLISVFGYSPRRIVWGFMIATALLSMVVLSTTAVLVMLPIAQVITNVMRSSQTVVLGRDFTVALMLGIAYASSIGSVATLVGAPPNLIFAGTVMKTFGYSVSFAEWSMLGAPLSFTMLAIAGLMLTRGLNVQGSYDTIRDVLRMEGGAGWSRSQIIVLLVLVIVLALMFTSPYWLPESSMITNSVIAIAGGISLFVIPHGRRERILDWAEVEKMPFGILFLLGGGLALSLSFINSGLAMWLAEVLSFIGILPYELVMMLLVALIMSVSNIKSNTATAAVFIPVVTNMVLLNAWPPLPILFAVTVASSLAFLLPMGTPPNALVYERGRVSIGEMFRKGIVLNAIAIGLIVLFVTTLGTLVLPRLEP